MSKILPIEPRTKRKGSVLVQKNNENPLSEKQLPKGWSDDEPSELLPRTRRKVSVKVASPPKRKRRTAAEMARDQSVLDAQKENDSELMKQKLTKIAELEDEMQATERERQKTAARPPSGNVVTKVFRPVTAQIIVPDAQSDQEEQETFQKTPNLLHEEDEEREVRGDYDADASEEPPKRMKKTKAMKGAQRGLIEERRTSKSDIGDKYVAAASDPNKCKQPNQDTNLPSKKTKSSLPSGPFSEDALLKLNPEMAALKSAKPKNITSEVSIDPTLDSLSYAEKFGGILDDAEKDIRPVSFGSKDGQSKMSIAIITRNAPLAKLEPRNPMLPGVFKGRRKDSKKEVFTHSSLPHGCLKAWKDHLIPAWRNFAGAQENPWNTSSPELCDDLQEIWDLVFVDKVMRIDLSGPIFGVAVQRWYEWRSAIGWAVTASVDAYMLAYSEDIEDCALHANFQLGDGSSIPFTWRYISQTDDTVGYRGLFMLSWIIAGLVSHLQMTSTVCKELQVDKEPCGALATAIVAAERAFTFWISGINTIHDVDRKDAAKFSDANWGSSTIRYFPSIHLLHPRQWEKIHAATQEYIETTVSPIRPSLSMESARSSSPPLDVQGSLFEEDSS